MHKYFSWMAYASLQCPAPPAVCGLIRSAISFPAFQWFFFQSPLLTDLQIVFPFQVLIVSMMES